MKIKYLALFLLVPFCLITSVQAAVQSPSVYIEDLEIEKSEYSPEEEVKGSVLLNNSEGGLVPDIFLVFKLTSKDGKIIDQQKSLESFYLRREEEQRKKFIYKLPAVLPEADLELKIKVINSRGYSFGSIKETINIIGGEGLVAEIKEPKIYKEGKEVRRPKPFFSEGQFPKIQVKVENRSSESISVFPKVMVYKRSFGGEIISEKDKEPVTISAGASKNYDISISEAAEKNLSLAQVQFYNKDKKPVSNLMYFPWVAGVTNDRILFATINTAGEDTKINIQFLSPMMQALESLGEDPTEELKEEIVAQLVDRNENKLKETTKEVTVSPENEIPISLNTSQELEGLGVVLKIVRQGKVLDQYSFKVNRGSEVSRSYEKEKKELNMLLIISVLVIIAIVAGYIIFRALRKSKINSKALSFLFVLLGLSFAFSALAIQESDLTPYQCCDLTNATVNDSGDCTGCDCREETGHCEVTVDCAYSKATIEWDSPSARIYNPGDAVNFRGSFFPRNPDNGAEFGGFFFTKITFYVTEDEAGKEIPIRDCCGNQATSCEYFNVPQCECLECHDPDPPTGTEGCYGAISTHDLSITDRCCEFIPASEEDETCYTKKNLWGENRWMETCLSWGETYPYYTEDYCNELGDEWHPCFQHCDEVKYLDSGRASDKIYKLRTIYPGDAEYILGEDDVPYPIEYDETIAIPSVEELGFGGPVRLYVQFSGTHGDQYYQQSHWQWKIAYQKGWINGVPAVESNRPPSASDSSVTAPQTCCSSPRNQVILSWDYNDEDGDSQEKYKITINGMDGEPDPLIIEEDSSVSSKILYIPGDLGYDKECDDWQVEVYDGEDWSADPAVGSGFTTPEAPYPEPDFTCDPGDCDNIDARVGEEVTLDGNESQCYTAEGDAISCSSFEWTLPSSVKLKEGTTLEDSQIMVVFLQTGEKEVTLEAGDGRGNSCQISKEIGVKKAPPDWREIAPFSFLLNWVERLFAGIFNAF